jgi:hypothetical protein
MAFSHSLGSEADLAWTSAVGTFETCRQAQIMSAYRGRPEVIGARLKCRD